MANIKKSFNFRNGVQVDDDNLKVSATGLVGIGTTVPTEALDVRGNLVVSGVSSAVTAQAGVMTVTTLNPTEIIGAGVSIVSGIVTASSGIITFYGEETLTKVQIKNNNCIFKIYIDHNIVLSGYENSLFLTSKFSIDIFAFILFNILRKPILLSLSKTSLI